MIKLLSATVAYVTLPSGVSSNLALVDFDGGYGYTDNSANITSLETSGGNPNNCLKGTSSSYVTNQRLIVDIDLGSTQSISEIIVDAYSDATGSTTGRKLIVGVGSTISSNNLGQKEKNVIPVNASWATYIASTDVTDFSSFTFPIDARYVRVDLFSALSHTTCDIRLDNITIVGSGGATLTYTLQKVSSLTGTSNWTDVSPAANQAPVRPHDFVIDRIDGDVLHTVADDDVWYSSANGATSWNSEQTSTNKRVPISQGDGIIFAGTGGSVELSLDGGTTFSDKTGNINAVGSSVGTIKRVLIL
jgi:hypothetical protein